MKPRVFIGSSSENKEIAEAIACNLDGMSFPEVWSQSLTTLSQSTLTNLFKALNTYDFAIFVFGAEDTATIREDELSIVRDNVIFETGLFMGKLGIDRVFFVKPKSQKIHMPSDLFGITYGEYDMGHPNKRAALTPFCTQVKDQIYKIYKPIMPREDIYGVNILNEDLTMIKSRSMSESHSITYGLYATTTSSQKIVVTITNKSEDKHNNMWIYSISQKRGWMPTNYNSSNGHQAFILAPDTIGILKISFLGEGSALLNVSLNDNSEPLLEKIIFWQ